MKFGYFVLLYFIGLGVRMLYEAGKKSGKLDSRKTSVFLVVFAGMSVMFASWFSMAPQDPINLGLSGAWRWFGFGLVAVGTTLALTTLFQLKGLENIERLVTSGLFARLRHPMYAGFILWFTGWPLFHSAGLSYLFGIIGTCCVLYWRSLEEEDLVKKHGRAYRDYQSRTWW
jgi:protein-S-isoprenylcysteine O-methyltransferase Ste14